MPIFSFLLPVFKIKKSEELSIKKRIIVDILSLIAIGSIDVSLLIVYIGVFLVIEGLYYYFEYRRRQTAIFDRIAITSIVVTSIMAIFGFLMKTELLTMSETLNALYVQKLGMTAKEINEIFMYIRENSLFLLFIYVGITTYLSYYFLKRKSYFKWEISYIWVVPYIITFFIINIFKFDNFYINNIFNITKVMYILFGIKVMASFFGKRINFKGLPKILSVVLALNFPTITFILGVIKSFNFKMKVRVIKK
jgi:hypothetical protein